MMLHCIAQYNASACYQQPDYFNSLCDNEKFFTEYISYDINFKKITT